MLRYGVDVSEYNGRVDWDAMKRGGVEFAILRASWGHFQEDREFRRNVDECERVGIPYGLYHYSYVANTEQMKEEAEGFLRQCQSCRPAYPCYIDMEDADGWKEEHHVSDATNIETCYYTCKTLEEAGYYAGIYASLYWLEYRINSRRLDRFDKWLAQWAEKPTYSRPFGMWQFSDDGKIDGVTGRFDRDIAYKDYPLIMKEKGLNGFEKEDVDPTPEPIVKYAVGDHVKFRGLWTQSNGGHWYPVDQLAVKEGTITKVIKTAEHPYLIDKNIGWADDESIVEKVDPNRTFQLGDHVSFDGLWTQSNGGHWYSKENLLIHHGVITRVISGAQHPYLIDKNLGWADARILHHR